MTITTLTKQDADKRDAIATLDELADTFADERIAWERLAKCTPGNLPHIAMTCNDIAATADHGFKFLARTAARVARGLAGVDIADAYIDASRIQLQHLTIARSLLGSIVRPVDDRNRKQGAAR